MKDEINKIIQSIGDFYKLDNALKYYLDRHKAQLLLDYIPNLQKENERLNNIINELEKYIEENIKITKQALKFEGLDDFDKKKYSRDITLFEMILDKIKELKEKSDNK